MHDRPDAVYQQLALYRDGDGAGQQYPVCPALLHGRSFRFRLRFGAVLVTLNERALVRAQVENEAADIEGDQRCRHPEAEGFYPDIAFVQSGNIADEYGRYQEGDDGDSHHGAVR